MKKKNLNSKLNLNRFTINNLKSVRGGMVPETLLPYLCDATRGDLCGSNDPVRCGGPVIEQPEEDNPIAKITKGKWCRRKCKSAFCK